MLKFYDLKVKEIVRETAECSSVLFELPEALKPVFSFKQGQHLTLEAEIDGERIRRPYSICASVQENVLRVAVKQMPGGKFSNWVNKQLKEGDIVSVAPPQGKFYTELDAQNQNNYVAFAAGSGITPVISIIKTVLETEPESHFTLFYANRSSATIIFKEALLNLKNQFLHRFALYHVLSGRESESPIFQGRIDLNKLERYSQGLFDPLKTDAFFLCGPQDLVLTIQDFLLGKGVPKKQIHLELFSAVAPAKKTDSEAIEISELDEGDSCLATLIVDGVMNELIIHKQEHILDVALQQHLPLPYACKGGVCSTCKAKLIEGQVSMDINYALEEEELAAGYILTCQARPLSKRLLVNFDV